MIKEKYEKLRKKHNLPNFETLDLEFEISLIESDTFLLREIRRKIVEKIEFYMKILEELLQTDISITTLYEIKFFNDLEREKVFMLYQKFMSIMRESSLINLDNIDNKNADFIVNVSNTWNRLKKKKITPILEKLKTAWEKEEDTKEILSYFG